MYKPSFLFDRTPEERRDPFLFWQREDQPFFAAGACHILAEMFRQLHQGEDFQVVFMKAKEGYPGAHVYIRYGEWIFDHNGWTLENEMIDTVRDGFRERYPGWDCDLMIIEEDFETFCRNNNHRLPWQYAYLPWERAYTYIKKFPEQPQTQSSMSKKITAIGFDWGGVIFVTPGRPFKELAAETAGVSLEEFNRAYFLHNHLHNKGTHSYEEMSIEILKELGKEDRIEAYLTFLKNLPSPQVDQRMLQLVRLLKNKGFKVGLLSNNSIKGADEARKIDLDNLFDAVIFSAEIGVMKPEPEAFLELARRLNVDITELAYIDDAEKSLSRAEEIGYEPILYKEFEQLLTRLVELDVLSESEKQQLETIAN